MKKVTLTMSSLTLVLLAALLVFGKINAAHAANVDPIRIVVLPFYVEQGKDAKNGGNATLHYRRAMRFINNQLVRHNFEVINPFAKENGLEEYKRLMEIAREDTALASRDVCKKYATDAAYITWLKVKVHKTSDGYCKASARLDGEGYDSADHDLGVGVSKTFKVTRRDCDDAIAEVEKEAGDLVGRKLTAWSGGRHHNQVVTAPAKAEAPAPVEPEQEGGALARKIRHTAPSITVRLDGSNEPVVVEIFGKVVKTVRGVEYAKEYARQIVPNNPQASYEEWRVTIHDTDPFILQANMLKMFKTISNSGGECVLKGVHYRYTAEQVDPLKGLRAGDATSRKIQFVLDREQMRDKELSNTDDAYQARKKKGQGFE